MTAPSHLTVAEAITQAIEGFSSLGLSLREIVERHPHDVVGIRADRLLAALELAKADAEQDAWMADGDISEANMIRGEHLEANMKSARAKLYEVLQQ